MKKTIAVGTIILASIGGLIYNTARPIYNLDEIPKVSVIGVYVSETARPADVRNVLNYLKQNNQAAYVGSEAGVSEEVKKELKKHSEIKEGFWLHNSPFPDERLRFLIQNAGGGDFAIIKL